MAHPPSCKREQSPPGNRPNMSDLRIVLLGTSVVKNNTVVNLILNKEALGRKMPSSGVHEFSERVEGRNITVISTSQLLNPEFQLQTITQEASALSPPEPHVIILVLQHRNFSKKQRDRLPSVLNCFGEQAMKRTLILTTDDEPGHAGLRSAQQNEFIQEISTECGGGHLQLHNTHSQLLKEIDEIIICSFKETQQVSSVVPDDRFMDSVRPMPANVSGKQKLNLVLCGSDGLHKVSVSKLLQGKEISMSHQRASSKECVKKDKEIYGRHISLLELPALSRLSKDEVMRQTLRCVSLCHPGVHAFLLIISLGHLTDEDKAEMEKILNIFDTKHHMMVLFFYDGTDKRPVADFIKSSRELQKLISHCGGQHCVIGSKKPENSKQIPELLEYIEKMKTEPYSPQMYVEAQENRGRREAEEKYKEELKRLENKIKELQEKGQLQGAEPLDDQNCLRIVLIGRTGNGKSATGNTILARNQFRSVASMDSVTTVCERAVGEVNGRSVAVVDTPGLFDTTLTNDQVVEEIVKCVSLSAPGPHVFIIVVSVVRFSREDTDTIDQIKKIFGPKSAQFSIVLFTREDELEDESIEDYVKKGNKAQLQKLIRDCGNRFLAFNNKEKQDRTQVMKLLKMIEEVKSNNQGGYFTNSMFEEAEMSIKKKMEEIMKEREREMQKQREELQAKHEIEMKNMMKRLEEKKQRAEEKMENQLKEKEEKINKDFGKEKTDEQQRAEYDQRIEEMKKEIESQKSQYEQQQKEREEEDRKREEKYREEQNKMRNEQERIIAELKRKHEEETKKRDLEARRRNEEEEKERQRWKRRIKEAENERKEIQEEIKRQQREWEDEKRRQMREREEEERKRKEKHEEQLREKQEEQEKMRKKFEGEREEERQKMEEERQKQRREREEKEREYEEKRQETKRHYERLERKRKEEWERRKQEYEERLEEERKKMIEDLKREQEEVEKEIFKLNQKHEEEIKVIINKHEVEVRKQAEEFYKSTESKLKHVLELTEIIKGNQMVFKSQNSRSGRVIQ